MGIRSRSSVREIRGGGGPVRFPRRLARRPTREFRRGDLFESPFEAPSNFPILFSYFNARPLFSVPGIPTCIPTPAPRPDNSMKSFRSSFPFSLSLFFLYPTIFDDARRSRRYKCEGKFYPFFYPSTWEKFFERILGS